MERTLVGGLAAVTVLALAQPAVAARPDDGALTRTLTCDGEQVVTTLQPGGFGTPFEVIGTTEVIIPKQVTVTNQAGTFTTIYVPGFDVTGLETVSCWYTDPLGLFVEFIGLWLGRST
jgi:hypothetical protein